MALLIPLLLLVIGIALVVWAIQHSHAYAAAYHVAAGLLLCIVALGWIVGLGIALLWKLP